MTHLARLLSAEIVILMPERSPSETGKLDPARRLSARQRVQRSRPRGGALVVGRRAADRARHRHPARRPLAVRADPHQPLVDRRDRRAVRPGEGAALAAAERRLLEAVGNQAAVAIERVTLAADIDQARLGAERERLRSAMLTSVSHDLRTPLASIIGCAVEPQELSRPLRRGDARRASGHRAQRSRAARPLRRQPARHDAARCRRDRAQARAGRGRRPGLDHAAPRRARPEGPGRRARPWRPTCRPCRSISCWPSRRCSTSSTMPRNIRRRAAASRSRRAAPAAGSRSSCATRGRASPPPRSTGCSTSSIAPTTATAGGRARGWGSPSPRASSRSRAARSLRAIAAIAAARSSWSATRT